MNHIFYWALLIGMFSFSCAQKEEQPKQEEVSGDYYDWTQTNAPEVAWRHNYNKTLVTKMFLCNRDSLGGVGKVYLDFEQTLEVIKRLDKLTLQIPKIVYLVGWQYNGHDSKYPSWDEVNKALKREQDSSALASLRWLMREAKQYNTAVSLHINMIDAFEDSPLWDSYLAQDVVAKDTLGNPIPGEMFWGMQSYQLSYAREWELGLAQKRIDRLMQLLPELKEAGTIHIDAFHSKKPSNPDEVISPYLNYSLEQELAAQRKIYRYWRSHGMDVTNEAGMYWLREDPFLGLQGMSWHYTERQFVQDEWMGKPEDFVELPIDLAGFTPMQCEGAIMEDPQTLPGLLEQVPMELVPWYYRRNGDVARYSNVLITDDQIIAPVLWAPRTLMAYSEKGDMEFEQFRLPSHWGLVMGLEVYRLTNQGLKYLETVETTRFKNGKAAFNVFLDISIRQGEVMVFKAKV